MAVSTPSTPRRPRPARRVAVGHRLPGRQEPGQGLRVDGVLTAIEQLAGCASARLGPGVAGAPARVADYEPALLDELTASGEVVWAGHGEPARHRRLGCAAPRRPGAADPARPPDGVEPAELPPGRSSTRSRPAARGSSVSSARPGRRPPTTRALAGRPVGPGLGRPRQQRHARPAARADPRRPTTHRTPPCPGSRSGDRVGVPAADPQRPTRRPGAGRSCPTPTTDPTRRAHAAAERLLDRHGVVTRGAVCPSGPGRVRRGLQGARGFEETGRCRRGYFVEGLGAAQFGTAGPSTGSARSPRRADRRPSPRAVTLAATDPANPYGAALPWPDAASARARPGHRPGPQGRRAWSSSSTAS